MSSVFDILSHVQSGAAIDDAKLDQWVVDSDPSKSSTFFGGGGDAAAAVRTIATTFVATYLNNSNEAVVPIRRKTRFLLVLNNFALFAPVRERVFDAVKELDDIFESSMKAEGKMAFDSELGRMSEHVLVLMMRCLSYKFKAQEVHEFAEQNTQFAVQLLLAVLLKEPPYEFELRCNCISGLLGFTTPQAFFTATDSSNKAIDFHDCAGFTEKIDFTLNLMLRLSALQVLNDVIIAQMYEHATIQPLEGAAVLNTMRTVMNIFQFSSKSSLQWRQHVLLSTTFLDGASILYIQGQVKSLETLLAVNSANVPTDVVRGLGVAMKFMGFATYHMGEHGNSIRPICGFIHNMLALPVHKLGGNSQTITAVRNVYSALLHFLCNIDALAGDNGIVEDPSELMPELTSIEMKASIRHFFSNEIVAHMGQSELQQLYTKFTTVSPSTLVATDSMTFQEIDGLFKAALTATAPAAATPAPQVSAALTLADMPTMAKKSADTTAKKKKKKSDSSSAAVAVAHVATGSTTAKAATTSDLSRFVCALSGNTMKVPVTSPHGYTFEKEAIEQWIAAKGNVCPITGKPLVRADLVENKALQSEILQEVIRSSIANVGQSDDIYDF